MEVGCSLIVVCVHSCMAQIKVQGTPSSQGFPHTPLSQPFPQIRGHSDLCHHWGVLLLTFP